MSNQPDRAFPLFSEADILNIFTNALDSDYEHKFRVKLNPSIMNVSSLAFWATGKAFIDNRVRVYSRNHSGHKVNMDLVRGSAIHEKLTRALPDWHGEHENALVHYIPYNWKREPVKTITFIAHPDFVKGNTVIEAKTTRVQEQSQINGIVERAKRQAGCYSKMLENKFGAQFEAFILVVNHELTVIKLKRDEIESGFAHCVRVALEAAEYYENNNIDSQTHPSYAKREEET